MYYTLRSKNAYQIFERDVPKMEEGVGGPESSLRDDLHVGII
jgi:hypothetical protein